MLNEILHLIGYGILWTIGTFLFPFIAVIIYGKIINWEEHFEIALIIFYVCFLLYLIATAIFLIII
ncbi:MAG: hypothetical protein PHS54_06305 [Clostridia bacterium]|nr:hypothetical protein [Clostridia bacterium]